MSSILNLLGLCCSPTLALSLQISLNSLFNSSTCSSFILFHHMLLSICHWILISCESPVLLSYVPFNLITHSYVYSLFHWITYIRLFHLASCHSCYISWFKTPFIRNSFTNLLLHQLFLFIPLHFVSKLFINIVSLVQHAFSYSLSIDLSLLMPLPFTSFRSNQISHSTLLDTRSSIFASCNILRLFIIAYFSAVLTILTFILLSLSQ